ncbi:DNA polymerase III subunit delta', partial [Francisella tularensis subsp. holarctica]|uniref:DNA polymerase III subunit delta' C-terminal domain-containing protein n=1 Tax=Francisella tularensis TaxID=263 RepID=UPI002381A9C9
LSNYVNLIVFIIEANTHFMDTHFWITSMIIDVYCYNLDEQNQGIANYDKLEIIKYLAAKFDADCIYKLYSTALESQSYFVNFKNV